jgi:peroxiredoxin Q/BCP
MSEKAEILKVGKKAPAFKLMDKDGDLYQLKDLLDDYTVIYFYPKDDTPGCTIEAQEFSKLLTQFKKLNIAVVGISGGDQKTKSKFCSKHKLKLLLLSDTDFSISKKYGVYGEKSFMGKKFMGINRVTYILNSAAKVIAVYQNVTAKGHATEILQYIKELKS